MIVNNAVNIPARSVLTPVEDKTAHLEKLAVTGYDETKAPKKFDAPRAINS